MSYVSLINCAARVPSILEHQTDVTRAAYKAPQHFMPMLHVRSQISDRYLRKVQHMVHLAKGDPMLHVYDCFLLSSEGSCHLVQLRMHLFVFVRPQKHQETYVRPQEQR